ncbi:MAG TPA: sigma-70 family RNA polymerase sigma factor [Planctomycetota bacterium]|nr:sigma-70 family RNA polymerase sigma factor [Planctomycetota bacterium]
MDDSELDPVVRGVLEGRRELYSRIVEACETRVRFVLATLLPDSALVEDVAQDTFVTAFRKLDQYRPGTDFQAWIGAVARNLALNERRSWARRQALLDRYRVQIEEAATAPLEALSGGLGPNARQSLGECIDQLQVHARGVVEAFYFDQLSSRDIAERHRRPPTWVLVVLHRARVAIGRCLKAKGVVTYEA